MNIHKVQRFATTAPALRQGESRDQIQQPHSLTASVAAPCGLFDIEDQVGAMMGRQVGARTGLLLNDFRRNIFSRNIRRGFFMTARCCPRNLGELLCACYHAAVALLLRPTFTSQNKYIGQIESNTEGLGAHEIQGGDSIEGNLLHSRPNSTAEQAYIRSRSWHT